MSGASTPARSASLGSFQLDVVQDGEFWLDGGAMFGVVPKVIWERLTPPDESNRIRLQTNCLLLRDGDRTMLVDTGIGDKGDDSFRRRFRIDATTDLIAALAALGVAPDDVDCVLHSHLHWDHAGWSTRRDPRGELIPTFPNARHVVQAAEWEEACEPSERSRASYRPEDFAFLDSSDSLQCVEGEIEVVPGVTVFPAPGHNRGMQGVRIESEGKTAIYLADIVPTRHHLRMPFIMGYDGYPATTLETKRRFLPMALENRWLVAFDHDPEIPIAYLEDDGSGQAAAVSPAGELD